jgi:hypothetical protein
MFGELFGLPPEELYKDMRPFFLNVHPEDRTAFHNSTMELAATLDEAVMEFRYVLDGKVSWYKTFSRGFERGGRFAYLAFFR